MIFTLIGGIGLFLLGMTLLTDGLKAVAGGALRKVLSRFVQGPLTALGSGTMVTVLVQSSSATTLATIGFVSAGLLTFPQTIGVLLGAKLGTTSTGWIVSSLGLKFSITGLALPVIGVGALMRLLGRRKIQHIGLALAGFGLIFVGIDTLQAAMGDVAERIDPSRFPGASFAGGLLLAAIGILMTVVMQSSSAAVATTLTALHSGAIDLNQAACLVIGQNAGTAITAAIAIIGASTAAVRTGIAYILFSTLIGVIAFFLLPWFLLYAPMLSSPFEPEPGAIAIAMFHTLFNMAGIIVLMPFANQLTRMVEWLVPEKGPALTRRLDKSVVRVPPVALEAVNLTLRDIIAAQAWYLNEVFKGKEPAAQAEKKLESITFALDETHRFMDGVDSDTTNQKEHARHLGTLHALDHVDRLLDACREAAMIRMAPKTLEKIKIMEQLDRAVTLIFQWTAGTIDNPGESLRAISESIANARKRYRVEILEASACKGFNSEQTLKRLESLRWADRTGYHFWRATHHLVGEGHEIERSSPFQD